ncbi:MAG: hypothetical protein IT581_04160 [Verrucomicrobiales bacterium]|nr:hypothetical protein [Verrucomicrobiales bacterium]
MKPCANLRRPGWARSLLLVVLLGIGRITAADETLDLSGPWRFALDRQDRGLGEAWERRELSGRVRLPGSLPQQGIGDPISTNTPWVGGIVDRSWFTDDAWARYRPPGQVKIPFWLQPETYYSGAAWYQREVEVPADWEGRRLVLYLERPHRETRVWWDDQFQGAADALGTPHVRQLGIARAGRHRLTVRVDNRPHLDVGHDSHSVSDHTQGNWNGIVGRVELQATPLVWIDDLQVYPRAASRSVRLVARLGNGSGTSGDGTISMEVRPVRSRSGADSETAASPRRASRAVQWTSGETSIEMELELGPDAPLWDEFQPALWELEAVLEPSGHRRQIRFGLRDWTAEGTQFRINGRATFLRGTLECSIFPKTGHPPVDLESWRRVMRAAKSHGLNQLRFHSHCPPEAAFDAADELGVYLHVEASSWANASTSLGDGKPVDRWLYEETDRILRYYGNHPSFVMMAYGNEPGGPRHGAFLATYVKHFRSVDPRRLWTSAAGWPQIPENEWHSTPDPRIQGWGQGLKSRINGEPPATQVDYRDYIRARNVPVVSHEIGQWCVYPNFDEMRKYTGYLKPRNFEIFKERLTQSGMGRLARPFLQASGKLQVLCYKEEIESALRTPGMGGFQLLDLHDFPGQGTALVGVLDPFWESKGYVTPAEYRRFCDATVPLARLSKRVFTTDEALEADMELAHYGPSSLRQAVSEWQLVDDRGQALRHRAFSPGTVEAGTLSRLGKVRLELGDVPAPAHYRLEVRVQDPELRSAADTLAPGKGTKASGNDWDVWVYPASVPDSIPSGVTVRRRWEDGIEAALRRGERVLWLIEPGAVRPDGKLGKVELGFSSIFWNTAWTRRQPPHTLGILCDPRHPLFKEFPTDSHSNWQWWYLVHRAGAMLLDSAPNRLEPVVRVIDDWVTARSLALVVEAKVGKGRLMACSVDIDHDLAGDPVRRQFRRSLLNYMASDQFRPRSEMTAAQARDLAVR